jgi:hypothetical protein
LFPIADTFWRALAVFASGLPERICARLQYELPRLRRQRNR